MRIKPILFGGTGAATRTGDIGILIMRVVMGLTLALTFGRHKVPPPSWLVADAAKMHFPLPIVFAWAAGLSELLGGLLVAIGLLTRPAALLVCSTMVTAAFIHKPVQHPNQEFAIAYLVIALFLVLAGAGRYSVDTVLRKKG